jgi:hypothetical protein
MQQRNITGITRVSTPTKCVLRCCNWFLNCRQVPAFEDMTARTLLEAIAGGEERITSTSLVAGLVLVVLSSTLQLLCR